MRPTACTHIYICVCFFWVVCKLMRCRWWQQTHRDVDWSPLCRGSLYMMIFCDPRFRCYTFVAISGAGRHSNAALPANWGRWLLTMFFSWSIGIATMPVSGTLWGEKRERQNHWKINCRHTLTWRSCCSAGFFICSKIWFDNIAVAAITLIARFFWERCDRRHIFVLGNRIFSIKTN